MRSTSRRSFLSAVSGASALSVSTIGKPGIELPIFISTWDFGMQANQAALSSYVKNKNLLDAIEAGVKVPEADISNQSVGYGGLPDRDGIVTLDACLMNHKGQAGSVCALENIMHPISVARKVMEKTPHVILVGEGALQFALSEGFTKQNLLTDQSKKDWEKWKITSKYQPIINIENHDTIGMIGMDDNKNMSGACTTSGLAYKMHGRVGDSPIIGAGLYIDNEIGCATGTGLGEKVLTQCSAFLIVELMRQGKSPQKACEEAIMRIVRKNKDYKDFQVAFIAMNKMGKIGAYSIHPGFNYALTSGHNNTLIKSKSYISA